jgi:hypothetical protein
VGLGTAGATAGGGVSARLGAQAEDTARVAMRASRLAAASRPEYEPSLEGATSHRQGEYACHRAMRPRSCVLLFGVLACCRDPSSAPSPVATEGPAVVREASLPPADEARPSPDASFIVVNGTGHVDASDGTATPPNTPHPTKAEIGRLRDCCKRVDAIGQAAGQEGVGFIGVASQCNDIASSLERGEPIQLGFQDWEAIHRSGLDDRRMPAGCRAAMTKFEKR